MNGRPGGRGRGAEPPRHDRGGPSHGGFRDDRGYRGGPPHRRPLHEPPPPPRSGGCTSVMSSVFVFAIIAIVVYLKLSGKM